MKICWFFNANRPALKNQLLGNHVKRLGLHGSVSIQYLWKEQRFNFAKTLH